MISHSLWLENPKWLMQQHRLVVTLALATLFYVCGLGMAALGSFLPAYLSSPAFILGALGIGWVVASINIRARRVDRLYQGLAHVFTGPASLYASVVNQYFERICRLRWHMALAALLFAGVLTAAVAAFYMHPVRIGGQPQASLRPWVFADSWYIGDKFAKFAITSFFGAAISVAMGVSLWLLYVELTLLRRLAELPPSLNPEVARVELRQLADFHARVAVDWSAGALLFVLLFMRTPDLFSISIVSACLLVAGVVYTYPHIALSRVIRQCHERRVRVAGRRFALALHQPTQSGESLGDTAILSQLADLTTLTHRPKFWVYSADESLRWALAQFIAFSALGLQIFVYLD